MVRGDVVCRVGGGGVFEGRGGAVVRRSWVWARWLRRYGYGDERARVNVFVGLYRYFAQGV